jgi:ATP-dependent RNA helicase UAP56/SUB2
MSRPEEEELVDYDEAAEETFAPAPAAATTEVGKAEEAKKGSYVGIHSTGFR